MAIYNYRARDQQGRVTAGAVEALTENEAAELLKDRGLFVLSLNKTSKRKRQGLNINIGRVKQKDIVIFSRQLSVMISATVPIVQSLRILAQQTSNPLFIEKISEMADDVDGGMKLSSSLGKHEKVFSRFYVAMVKSGETSGKLDEVLQYLADQMEKDYDLVSRIKGAMIYPVFIVVGMISVGFIMMVFVVPKMTAMLKETGSELPFLTRVLIFISDFMKDNWIFILIGLVVLIVLFKLWVKSKAGQIAWDSIKIKIPLFGTLFRKIYIIRFTRGLATLISGGVPIAKALGITAEVVDNKAYKQLVLDTVDQVEDGKSVAALFATSDLMPKMLSQMMIVGEKTGRLDTILEKLSDFYSREIDNLVAGLTSLIEPLILIIMGVGVGGMVAAIMLPMFKVAQGMA
ncbi:MAG: phytochrome sensor protein [Candidatus Komeilibacteria bacterium CG11_big_fil_rev_8_21_14_0_20_36_20]|uniref:Phytochrome sensor protein n=1 Tax=Candidatus Komeilibacteria bacterium CG11_big_fil_rev_8_21_14_0_20_36_20 TaxID=1974477 RepID=A0A2H0ND94_9BACT|nr:MAG: phytochrome sensor protein [Candidatus Komeilibacteria bacterium CG11_big_fil_rev_8_21_14_0_20_36_20]PIR81571.1 MAG: phytochrome sensor protein [Candidatus Komeilibacteria bacterium CG10_big_fil_rev_8_21_14_0_10_36_65]PJC55409.1 MAG: phytochrome sensor protein [Candidatus Komeilibacteria bacterium CG_4_9_14_0_2_um_filter_36_13]